MTFIDGRKKGGNARICNDEKRTRRRRLFTVVKRYKAGLCDVKIWTTASYFLKRYEVGDMTTATPSPFLPALFLWQSFWPDNHPISSRILAINTYLLLPVLF